MTLPGERILSLPALPDFLVCDATYGRNIPTLDCVMAADNRLLKGTEVVSWRLGGLNNANARLPQISPEQHSKVLRTHTAFHSRYGFRRLKRWCEEEN